ncbi:TPR domain-containing protein [Naegleria gruberi]|uniref:TPR domain-containing protein n=1 Tax=Naegleria gruberi TaxID=5762 RepID=D2VZ56_NAEGR|nr:TPR domain-containing protein [Naegleria gruberi]EFC37883.1 TPR domain-containing protein [Naegleria gruberi]|eukprot:XP_002670627.1 TPR domain-containing protein [Naegleria gruberi strain NEG-M]
MYKIHVDDDHHHSPPIFIFPTISPEWTRFWRDKFDKIGETNAAIMELYKNRQENYVAHRLESNCSLSIEEMKKHSEDLNEKDKGELCSMLMRRSIARMEISKFEEAVEDVEMAIWLMDTEERRNHFIVLYILGMAQYGACLYRDAAHTFMKAIDNRESMNQYVNEEEFVEMEKEFLNWQLESKKPFEKTILGINQGMTNWNNSIFNAKNSVKNWLNHSLGLNTSDAIIQSRPKTVITLELLYIRAGLAYFDANIYQNAIPLFTHAIDLGSKYKSDNVGSSFYNRGLCYYFSWDFQQALEDFSHSIQVQTKPNEKPFIMRSSLFSRIGKQDEYEEDYNCARNINPRVYKSGLSQYRHMSEDTFFHMLSFLETKQIVQVVRTCKHWKSLVTKYLQEKPVLLSDTFIVDKRVAFNQDPRSPIMQTFFPKKTVSFAEFFRNALIVPILCQNVAHAVCFESDDYWKYNNYTSLTQDLVKHYKNLKTLKTSESLYDDDFNNLAYNSPNIESIELDVQCQSNQVSNLLTKFDKLTRIRFGSIFFTPNMFANHNPSLKTVEYRYPTKKDVSYLLETTTYEQLVADSDNEMKSHPEITFQVHKYPNIQ